MRREPLRPPMRSAHAGLTLIEFMISIVLGMVVVAAMATLIANQSGTRADVDRVGRLIENGRYAMQTMVDDLQMAGYWGESNGAPTTATTGTFAALPDPCSIVLTPTPAIQEATYFHIQGYDDKVMTSSLLSCVSNWKSGTDVLVVRRADPDYSAILNAGAVDLTKLTAGQVYLQTGLTSSSGTVFSYGVHAASSTASTNTTNFPLVKKDGTLAPPRKLLVHIYYVSTCDVCTGTVDTIPTLKRVELGAASGSVAVSTVTIAEGVENLQFEYGLDTVDGVGSPAGTDGDSSAFGLTDWTNAMSVKIYLMARSNDASPGYTDTKSYAINAASAASAPTGYSGYQRHLFVQSVRLANPSMRRG